MNLESHFNLKPESKISLFLPIEITLLVNILKLFSKI